MKELSHSQPKIPVPSEKHGWTRVNGVLEALWIVGQVLPQRFADILQDTIDADSDYDAEEDEEGDDEEIYDVVD